jgi:presenilin-like A22 family membrane protease
VCSSDLLFSLLFILFIIFVLKSKRIKNIIVKTLFILATGLGGILTIGVWQSKFIALLSIVFLIFAWLKTKSILIHNLLLILGMAGIGSAMGLRIEPLTGVIILIIFSFYDYIAVYETKHMVKMAKEMTEQGAVLALIIPQKTSGFKASLKEVRPGGEFLVLGGGDITFPLLFSVSLIPSGIINSIIVAIFSLFGLLSSFLIFITRKERHPIPALPPIALFSIIGFLITLIF